jgi:hypothetical protein
MGNSQLTAQAKDDKPDKRNEKWNRTGVGDVLERTERSFAI